MGRPGKGLITSLDLRIKNPENKQNISFAFTDITKYYFSKFLKKFNNSDYLDYNSKQVHNEPNQLQLFLIK